MNTTKLIFLLLLFAGLAKSMFGQDHIAAIEKLLYPTNVDTITFNFNCRGIDKVIIGRDFYPSEDKLDSILYLVINTNDSNDLTKLEFLLNRIEHTFLHEWEPVWCNYSYRYHTFFSCIVAIEQTLQLLHIKQNLKTSEDKYTYLKNLVLCGRNSTYCVEDKIRIFSSYVKSKKWSCWATYFCGA